MKIEAINTTTGKSVFLFSSLTTHDDQILMDALGAQMFSIMLFETHIQQPMDNKDRVEVEFTIKITP